MSDSPSGPGVHFPPPLLFVAGIALGVALQRFWSLTYDMMFSEDVRIGSGYLFGTVGAGILAWGLVTFRRSRTAIYPNQPALQIVQHGPYRFSRNPMYVGLGILTAGLSLIFDNVWILLTLPPTLLVLTAFVVRREEAYLTASFGETYQRYCQQVRRWL